MVNEGLFVKKIVTPYEQESSCSDFMQFGGRSKSCGIVKPFMGFLLRAWPGKMAGLFWFALSLIFGYR